MQGKIRVYCYLFEAMIEYYVERRAQGFGDVLCRLKLTRGRGGLCNEQNI